MPSASLDLKVPILNLPRGLLHVSLISMQLPLFLESEYFAPHIVDTYYSLKIKYVPKKLASQNSRHKKDDKVGNKTAYKEERQGKTKSERERSK